MKLCENCDIKIEPAQVHENGWWWNPNKDLRYWYRTQRWSERDVNTYKKSAPKLCLLCGQPWDKDCMGWDYLEDFPIRGCVDCVCPQCSGEAEKESLRRIEAW